MKFNLFSILIGSIFFTGCYTPPEFPIEPSIVFEEVIFKDIENFPDSLIVTIQFQDGDGDLGLSANETNPPYNPVWYYYKNSNEELITYYDKFHTPGFDTLPPYEFPYTCQNWVLNSDVKDGTYVDDTVYYQSNADHFNIFVRFFVRKNGVYTEFDWETAFDPQCSDSYNGRFPLLSDLSKSPLEGKLRYGMTSAGFNFLFRNDTLKLELHIKDRALHTSNIVESPDFTLKSITVDDDQ